MTQDADQPQPAYCLQNMASANSPSSDHAAAFVAAVGRICRAAGGVRLPGEGPVVWQIETRAGKLRVSPQYDESAPWIACWFLEPNRAMSLGVEVNATSGKCLFKLWRGWCRNGSPHWHPATSNGLKYFEARLWEFVNGCLQPLPQATRQSAFRSQLAAA